MTLLPLLWSMFGAVYAIAAVVLRGRVLRASVLRLHREIGPFGGPPLLFRLALYLALLFVAMAVDPLVL